MVDETKIRDLLVSLLEDVAAKAKADAKAGKSDISSIWNRSGPELASLDPKQIEKAIQDVNKATATKEGAARLVSSLMLAASVIVKAAL